MVRYGLFFCFDIVTVGIRVFFRVAGLSLLHPSACFRNKYTAYIAKFCSAT